MSSEITYEFFATEDGEPWCAFVWGHHPAEQIGSTAMRAKILREADVFDFGEEARGYVEEAMQSMPEHLWIKQLGEINDGPLYNFCPANAAGAIAITGWKMGA